MPKRAPIQVSRLEAKDRHAVVSVLARAFWPDPIFGFFARHPLHEYTLLPGFFGPITDDALPFGEVYAARVDGRLAGGSVWLPPEGLPRSRRRDRAMEARIARVMATSRNRRIGLQVAKAIDDAHPREPHWYLGILGTDPTYQGRGVGSALLDVVLPRVDEQGLPAYLETQKEENLPFYRRFGFEVSDEMRVPGAPPLWGMRRQPQVR
jgi:GNAT superfamily N-acetyltransferase